MGEWRYSSTFLDIGTRLNGQLYAPAFLPPTKEPPVKKKKAKLSL
jgi:hypothetical protein